jgi:hypothetical protein
VWTARRVLCCVVLCAVEAMGRRSYKADAAQAAALSAGAQNPNAAAAAAAGSVLLGSTLQSKRVAHSVLRRTALPPAPRLSRFDEASGH